MPNQYWFTLTCRFCTNEAGNQYCRSSSCIQSAKGLLCLALNGGFVFDVPRSASDIKTGHEIIPVPYLVQDPPLSGLSLMTGVGDDDQMLDMHIPQSVTGNMFCVDGFPSHDNPPCFTQCMDLLTPYCDTHCMGKDNDEIHPQSLPCSKDGPQINPVCYLRQGQEYKLDVRFEPWASCFRNPFKSPVMSSDMVGCAGRVPMHYEKLLVTFSCADVYTGICGNPATLYDIVDDPFYIVSMSLAHFLQINPIGIRKPSNSPAWTSDGVVSTIGGKLFPFVEWIPPPLMVRFIMSKPNYLSLWSGDGLGC